MAADCRPGVLDQAGPGALVTEDPPVLPVRVELAEVPGRDPARPLVRMRVARPLPGELPHVGRQRLECLAADRAATSRGPLFGCECGAHCQVSLHMWAAGDWNASLEAWLRW